MGGSSLRDILEKIQQDGPTLKCTAAHLESEATLLTRHFPILSCSPACMHTHCSKRMYHDRVWLSVAASQIGTAPEKRVVSSSLSQNQCTGFYLLHKD